METATVKTIDLNQVRVKMIADMPNNPFKVGKIITDLGQIEGYNMREYPHLFKFLEWWEDRTEEELLTVKYLKAKGKLYEGEVHEVLRYTAKYFGYHSGVRDAFIGDLDTHSGMGSLRELSYFVPATKEEYLSARKSNEARRNKFGDRFTGHYLSEEQKSKKTAEKW